VRHIASTDVQMLDDIADHKFTVESHFKDEPKSIKGETNTYCVPKSLT
jgi:hypothetical protein